MTYSFTILYALFKPNCDPIIDFFSSFLRVWTIKKDYSLYPGRRYLRVSLWMRKDISVYSYTPLICR